MEPIKITIDSNAAAVLAQLTAAPAAMMDGIRQAMDRQNEITTGVIQEKRMSRRGPDTLGVRTNRLRSSLRPSKAVVNGQVVDSAIGSNVVYMGVHEFGFDGSVQVKAHTRRRFAKAGKTTAIATSLFFDMASGKIRKGRTIRKRAHLGDSQVKAHARHMRMPARAPIQRGIQATAKDYSAAVSAAILQTWSALGGGPAPAGGAA